MSRTDLGTNDRCEQGEGTSVYWRRFKGPIFFATHGRRKGRMRPFDDNGVELYYDRPRQDWARDPDGRLQMYSRTLDLEDLLRA